MASKSWQLWSPWLLLVGSLCIGVGANAAETQNKLQASTRVSYKPTKSKEVLTPDINRQVDLSTAASYANSGFLMPAAQVSPYNQQRASNSMQTAQNIQPSVYHSIVDRTTASTQLALPVQATTSTVGDLNTAAGHHHGHAHGKYYEYREVPEKHTWKFGYRRGNHKHTIERHEHGKAGKKHPHFKTKVKWHDKKSKGKGIHLWDYNHHDKKHYHHG